MRQDKYIKRLEDLVRTLIENDPMEPISDAGHVVLDLWRHDAEQLLRTVVCETCAGDGSFFEGDMHHPQTCTACNGKGEYEVERKPITLDDLEQIEVDGSI